MIAGLFGLVALVALAVPASAAGPKCGSSVAASNICAAYGSGSGSNPPPSQPTCSISPTSASPGQTVNVHVDNVANGTSLSVLFDGNVVATGVVTAPSGSTTGSADIPFAIPSNATPGTHTVFVSGAGVQCDPTAGSGFQVLGETIGTGTGTGSSSSSGGSLARTGVEVGLLVAIALVCLVVGAQLVRASRRRRQQANRVRHLVRD